MGVINILIEIIMEQWNILIASRTVAAAIFCAGAMIFFFIAKIIYHREISILKATISSLKNGCQAKHKPININNFDIIENPGVALHKKTQEIFCLKCLLQKNIKSPLIVDHCKGYMCRNCGDVIFSLDNWQEFIQFSKEWRPKTHNT